MANGAITYRENYLKAARRQNPAWIPFDAGMSAGFAKKFHAHAGPDADLCEYFNYDGRWIGPGPTRRPTPDWRAMYYADGSLPDNAVLNDAWGTAHVYYDDSDNQRDYFPLRNITTPEEVDAYPWPDIGAEYRFAGLAERTAELQARGLAVHANGPPGFFEPVWGLRGFDTLMMDMASGEPLAARLFDRLRELSILAAEGVARAGADVMPVGADVATQRGPLMSRELWRTYIRPVMADSIQAAKRIKPDILVDYHSCGDVSAILDDLVETGIDILNPCQPEVMDIFELKRRYGNVLSFHGGIGVQSVLPYGTPGEVKDTVRRTIEIMGAGGGYICSPSHNLRPEIPWENVIAMVEAIKEYGHP